MSEEKKVGPMIEVRRVTNGYAVDVDPRRWDSDRGGRGIKTSDCFEDAYAFETFESLTAFLRARFAHEPPPSIVDVTCGCEACRRLRRSTP